MFRPVDYQKTQQLSNNFDAKQLQRQLNQWAKRYCSASTAIEGE